MNAHDLCVNANGIQLHDGSPTVTSGMTTSISTPRVHISEALVTGNFGLRSGMKLISLLLKPKAALSAFVFRMDRGQHLFAPRDIHS
jgi:hypothetical protein